MNKTSLFEMSGLPQAFGVVLLVLSLILCAAPYASGMNFGQLNIPDFSERAKKRLKIIGPVILLSCVLCFVPFFRENKQGNFEAERQRTSSKNANVPSTCTDPSYVAYVWSDNPSEHNAPISSEFSISKPVTITNICTRHLGWKGIRPPGAFIKLLNSAGEELDSCKVHSGEGEEWKCTTKNIQLPIGTYRVIDPDPESWSQNAATNHKGMFFVLGCPAVK